MSKVTAKSLIDRFSMELLGGEDGIYRPITTSDISRPGMEMAGFFTYYPRRRLQLLGRTELTFLERLTDQQRTERMQKLCTPNTPGVIISRGLEAPPELMEAAEASGVPIMRADMTTTRLISMITNFLEAQLADTTAVHGVLVDIYGIGVLITGASGVGKSETALDLVRRGHRLVADDSVEISQQHADTLMGQAPELIRHLLEIRGLGIIDVMTLFGAGAVRPFKRITLNVHLELWDEKKAYDRLGIDEEKLQILESEIPKYTIPVRPGRNLAVIVEVAAMNFRLKRMGINAAQEFSNKLMDVIEDYDKEEL
ncbi:MULTISPECIES: HPr(Ser) kinase/phosphatase [Geomicrobium]|uniref:HPr kinase/phosphorylase n=1 Tax=Geomicrobium sediminis TaxID=1347788 RepID=A0ABS2P772_9BACL|nr:MULTISPECIES: HPr(Ser) kinase/phosphatase [Geomicrobium]EZH66429.1 serine kinase [Bacillaceae bacterium JMAK1]MBM7631252.1 HPr kinase/phosphorylase [Geomicrobium sediminis]